MAIGIIGGTGIEKSIFLDGSATKKMVNTPYGSVGLLCGTFAGTEIYFLNRHGYDEGQCVLPHCINYQANIWAFASLGIHRIIGTASVGSFREDFPPGSLGILSQFIDFTKGRKSSFYQGTLQEQGKFVHMTYPYCPEMNSVFVAAGKKLGIPLLKDLVYVCTEGPRFETLAEIKAYRLLGGDVVGMTSAPEAILCRELGICYSSLAMSLNMAAGMTREYEREIFCFDMKLLETQIVSLLAEVIQSLPAEKQCDCLLWSKGV